MAQLPDTTGLKNELVFQAAQTYGYDRSYSTPGGKLVMVGDQEGCTVEQMEAAIGPDTAAIAYLVKKDWRESLVTYDEAVNLARKHGLPILADCAAQIYPLDYFRDNAQKADLACFEGKYIGAPHSTGFLCGKKEFVEAAVGHGFIADGKPFRRAMKMDRQEIVGLATALSEWFTTDHEERTLVAGGKLGIIEDAVRDLDAVTATSMPRDDTFTAISLSVDLDTAALGKDAGEVVNELSDLNPRVRAESDGSDTLVFLAHSLRDGEPEIVADGLREVLSS